MANVSLLSPSHDGENALLGAGPLRTRTTSRRLSTISYSSLEQPGHCLPIATYLSLEPMDDVPRGTQEHDVTLVTRANDANSA